MRGSLTPLAWTRPDPTGRREAKRTLHSVSLTFESDGNARRYIYPAQFSVFLCSSCSGLACSPDAARLAPGLHGALEHATATFQFFWLPLSILVVGWILAWAGVARACVRAIAALWKRRFVLGRRALQKSPWYQWQDLALLLSAHRDPLPRKTTNSNVW